MEEKISYCVEYRRGVDPFYPPTFRGFDDKEIAIGVAKKASKTVYARVVKQTRKVIKVFPITSHSS